MDEEATPAAADDAGAGETQGGYIDDRYSKLVGVLRAFWVRHYAPREYCMKRSKNCFHFPTGQP
jgi:hypothetical protein